MSFFNGRKSVWDSEVRARKREEKINRLKKAEQKRLLTFNKKGT